MKFITLAALLVSAVAVSAAVLPIVEPKHSIALAADKNQPETVTGDKTTDLPRLDFKTYIVVFKNSATIENIANLAETVKGLDGYVVYKYDTVLNGFAVRIPDYALPDLATLPFIDYIEEDGVVSTQ